MKEVKDYSPSKDPRLINCKTECGNKRCYARRYGLFAEKTCPNFVEPKPIRHADRIRAMTDEELAVFIRDLIIDRNIGIPSETWLDWLRQEADHD